MFLLLKALSRKGSGSIVKNDLEVYLQGVFNDGARRRKAPKHSKVFLLFFSIFIALKI